MNTIKPVAYYGDNKKELGKQADGSSFGYTDIDREKLSAFALFRDDKKIIKLHLDEDGKRLIWRKREYKRPGKSTNTIHLLGWQKTVNGKNVQSIAYVFDDGHIELAGRFKENHPIFDKVELIDEEKGE